MKEEYYRIRREKFFALEVLKELLIGPIYKNIDKEERRKDIECVWEFHVQ